MLSPLVGHEMYYMPILHSLQAGIRHMRYGWQCPPSLEDVKTADERDLMLFSIDVLNDFLRRSRMEMAENVPYMRYLVREWHLMTPFIVRLPDNLFDRHIKRDTILRIIRWLGVSERGEVFLLRTRQRRRNGMYQLAYRARMRAPVHELAPRLCDSCTAP